MIVREEDFLPGSLRARDCIRVEGRVTVQGSDRVDVRVRVKVRVMARVEVRVRVRVKVEVEVEVRASYRAATTRIG